MTQQEKKAKHTDDRMEAAISKVAAVTAGGVDGQARDAADVVFSDYTPLTTVTAVCWFRDILLFNENNSNREEDCVLCLCVRHAGNQAFQASRRQIPRRWEKCRFNMADI